MELFTDAPRGLFAGRPGRLRRRWAALTDPGNAAYPAGKDEVFCRMARKERRPPPEAAIDVAECQRRIGYEFRDPALLVAALTHASGAQHRLASNERLEFLGDAILGFLVCETLYRAFPESLEGDLTRIKSVVVSRETCSRISEQLQLIDFLIVGKGLSVTRPVPTSVLSDLFESLVAAIYLDGGLDAVRPLVDRFLLPEIAEVASGAQGSNHKSLLQQWAQRDFGITPTYEVIEETGPDHSKSFHVSAQNGARRYSPAWGRNKKEAEQRAASNALVELRSAAEGGAG
jgi:ribonuclease-3